MSQFQLPHIFGIPASSCVVGDAQLCLWCVGTSRQVSCRCRSQSARSSQLTKHIMRCVAWRPIIMHCPSPVYVLRAFAERVALIYHGHTHYAVPEHFTRCFLSVRTAYLTMPFACGVQLHLVMCGWLRSRWGCRFTGSRVQPWGAAPDPHSLMSPRGGWCACADSGLPVKRT